MDTHRLSVRPLKQEIADGIAKNPRMHILAAGGAGFIGANLCRALLKRGAEVTVIDNLYTGRRSNLDDLPIRFIEGDICDRELLQRQFSPDRLHFDGVINLACPASPPAYQSKPIETLLTGSLGTVNTLEIARAHQARYLLTSTSEIYGEPAVHPQTEEYRGNVNPVGPRSMYDEAKRFSEAAVTAYAETYGLSTAIVRIFNTYGPFMQPDDGRVVTNFLNQALDGAPLTIYGDGSQTRSFCYVDDLVEGLLAMLDSRERGPVNLGNPQEVTIRELVETVREITGKTCEIAYRPLPGDDPTRRCPDITKAKTLLHWQPHTDLRTGLQSTWEWFQR